MASNFGNHVGFAGPPAPSGSLFRSWGRSPEGWEPRRVTNGGGRETEDFDRYMFFKDYVGHWNQSVSGIFGYREPTWKYVVSMDYYIHSNEFMAGRFHDALLGRGYDPALSSVVRINGGVYKDYFDIQHVHARIFSKDADDIIRIKKGGYVDAGRGNDKVFSSDENDVVYGQEGNDKIYAGAGRDRVFGGLGDDIIDGGRGGDELFGGSGDDVIMTGPKDKGIGNVPDIIWLGAGSDTVLSADVTATPGTKEALWAQKALGAHGDHIGWSALTLFLNAMDIAGLAQPLPGPVQALKALAGIGADWAIRQLFYFGAAMESKPVESAIYNNVAVVKDFNFSEGDVAIQLFGTRSFDAIDVGLSRNGSEIVVKNSDVDLLKVQNDPSLPRIIAKQFKNHGISLLYSSDYISEALQLQTLRSGYWLMKKRGKLYFGSINEKEAELSEIGDTLGRLEGRLDSRALRVLKDAMGDLRAAGNELDDGTAALIFGHRSGGLLHDMEANASGQRIGIGTNRGDVIFASSAEAWSDNAPQMAWPSSATAYMAGFGDNDRLYGFEGRDVILGGSGADLIYGASGRDKLFGDEGNDVIFGGLGNDEIFSGPGRDFLNGGPGNDVFYLSPGSGNSVTIQDFTIGHDKLARLGSGRVKVSAKDTLDGLLLQFDDGAYAVLRNVSLDQYVENSAIIWV